jgi:hypothetical protein
MPRFAMRKERHEHRHHLISWLAPTKLSAFLFTTPVPIAATP